MKIGVFDSGIGGLTVLKEIINRYPKGNYLYYGDTLHLPYGEKITEQLLEYSQQIIDFFLEQQVDKIVIACGTVSSTIYQELKAKYDIEFINVIDATVEAIYERKLDSLAVLATSRTIESHIFSNKLDYTKILEVACPKFVPYIEQGLGKKEEMIKEYLEPLKQQNIKHIILGCTHYPLLQEDIQNYFEYPVQCYNMGTFVASTITIKEEEYRLTLYFSKIDKKLKENIDRILSIDYEMIEKVL